MSLILGGLLNITGSVSINLGSNLIKYSHLVDDNNPNAVARAPLLQQFEPKSIWRLGTAIFAIGNVLNFVSFSFGSQSVLSALGSVQFISNVLLSNLLFRVAIDAYSQLATYLILAGNVTVVLFSSWNPRTNFSTADLVRLWYRTAYLCYLLSAAVLICLFQFGYVQMGRAQGRYQILQSRLSNPLLLPKSYKIGRAVCFSLVSGIIGTQSVLLAKSVSAILKETLAGSNQLGNPLTYVILIAWIFVLVFWLTRMNTALTFDVTFIIPLLQVIWVIFSIVSGGIYFQEFDGFETSQAILYTIGVIMIIIGVVLLAHARVDDANLKAARISIPERPVFRTLFNLDTILAIPSKMHQHYNPAISDLGKDTNSEHPAEKCPSRPAHEIPMQIFAPSEDPSDADANVTL